LWLFEKSDGKRFVGAWSKSENGGLASLDNPPVAIKLQRMGHPDPWLAHILKPGRWEFLDFAAAKITHLSDDKTVAKMGHPDFVGCVRNGGLALRDNPPFAIKLQRMGHPIRGSLISRNRDVGSFWIFAAAKITHLSDDKTVAKMGHPANFWGS
jgi:hypothetical protein